MNSKKKLTKAQLLDMPWPDKIDKIGKKSLPLHEAHKWFKKANPLLPDL